MTTQTKIYLVGSGPGDPDLLTVKALRLIQTAQTLVYDRLVSREILNLVPDSVSRIYVGKAPGRHTLRQSEISALLGAGSSPQTPAAIVEHGTMPGQRRIITTVAQLQSAVEHNNIESPAMLIIGAVVTLSQELDWFMPAAQEMELKYA